MPYELINFPGPDALAKQAATDWLVQLKTRLSKPSGPYTVALSGGRITKNFFDEIVRQCREKSDGSEQLVRLVDFFWADERCVPPTDPESNYTLAHEHLFAPLKIPDNKIHRLRGEGAESAALQEAIQTICRIAPVANGQPVLDLAFLGMGENGHTASLFPEEADEVRNDPAVYRAVTATKPPPRRITLGYAALAAAHEVWVLISGAGKEDCFRETLSPAGNTPLGRVIKSRYQTRIYSDIKL